MTWRGVMWGVVVVALAVLAAGWVWGALLSPDAISLSYDLFSEPSPQGWPPEPLTPWMFFYSAQFYRFLGAYSFYVAVLTVAAVVAELVWRRRDA